MIICHNDACKDAQLREFYTDYKLTVHPVSIVCHPRSLKFLTFIWGALAYLCNVFWKLVGNQKKIWSWGREWQGGDTSIGSTNVNSINLKGLTKYVYVFFRLVQTLFWISTKDFSEGRWGFRRIGSLVSLHSSPMLIQGKEATDYIAICLF